MGTDHLVLGKVEYVRVGAEAYAGRYKISIESWQPLASLAGDYVLIKPAFSVCDGVMKSISEMVQQKESLLQL